MGLEGAVRLGFKKELEAVPEGAERQALYDQMRKKGMSHLEASFYARDMLDFSMQGSWPAFRFLTQVVPFLNARVQGLYKLGRDGISPTARVIYNTATGKEIESSDKVKAQAFSVVTMAVAMASLARLLTGFSDPRRLRQFNVRFAGITRVGDQLTCTATVTERFIAGGEQRIRLQLQAADQKGDMKVAGEAVLAI